MSINPARSFASALPAQIWTDFWLYYFVPSLAMLCAAQIYLQYPRRAPTICCKLCPNDEQKCIAKKCCGECEDMVRTWRSRSPQKVNTSKQE